MNHIAPTIQVEKLLEKLNCQRRPQKKSRRTDEYIEWLEQVRLLALAFYESKDEVFDTWNNRVGLSQKEVLRHQALTAARIERLRDLFHDEEANQSFVIAYKVVAVHRDINGLAIQVIYRYHPSSGAWDYDEDLGGIYYFHSLNKTKFDCRSDCDFNDEYELTTTINELYLNAKEDIERIKLTNKFKQCQVDDMLSIYRVGDVMGLLTVPQGFSLIDNEYRPSEFYQIVDRPSSIRKPRKNKVVLRRINSQQVNERSSPLINSFIDDELINVKITAPDINHTCELIRSNIRYLRCKVNKQQHTHAYLMRPDGRGAYKLVYRQYAPTVNELVVNALYNT